MALVQEKGGFINEEGFLKKATSQIKLCILKDCDSMQRFAPVLTALISLTLKKSIGLRAKCKETL